MVKPRKSLYGLSVCEHGGKRKKDKEKDKNREIIDFSVNLNPYGPPNFVFDTIKEATEEINLYPDTESSELREKISRKFGCRKEEILIGAGVSELIQLVALSFVKNQALMLKHTYGEYEIAAKMVGAEIKRIEMPIPSLKILPELIVEEMKRDDVVFLCNPNNPTGQYLGKKEIEQLIEEAERVDALLVIDEAYVDFVRDAFPSDSFISSHAQNVIILRSLTKSYAIPGVRIGYALSSPENIREMMKVKTPWSVSVFAQKIGVAAIANNDFLAKTTEWIEKDKRKMENRFKELNMHIHSDANFYVLDISRSRRRNGKEEGDEKAREVKNKLLKHRILVRDCASFGLPSHIRFSVKKEKENERLIDALQKYLKHA